MEKRFLVLAVAIGLGSAAGFPAALPAQMAPGPREALEGMDPVLLTQGKEVPGRDAFSTVRGPFTYLFATAENKAAFDQNPGRYAIQLEGSCARMGAPTSGNPNIYAVHDRRIYIFGTEDCKTRFEAAPAKYLEPTAVTLEASGDAMLAGRALLDKTAAALGALDALHTFEQRASFTRPGNEMQPAMQIRTAILWSVPDRLRLEQEIPQFGTVASVLAPAESFMLMPRGARPLPPVEANAIHARAARHPLLLLRSRRSETLKALARGADEVALQVFGGPVMTLRVDASTGRPSALSYRGRGPEGDFGDARYEFADYREVGGVWTPFRITATFNGAPWPDQSLTIESIAINQPIDASRFQRPAIEERR